MYSHAETEVGQKMKITAENLATNRLRVAVSGTPPLASPRQLDTRQFSSRGSLVKVWPYISLLLQLPQVTPGRWWWHWQRRYLGGSCGTFPAQVLHYCHTRAQ